MPASVWVGLLVVTSVVAFGFGFLLAVRSFLVRKHQARMDAYRALRSERPLPIPIPPDLSWLDSARVLVEQTQHGTVVHAKGAGDAAYPTSDLLEIAENQETGTAMRNLGESFDTLFRRLGPPPDSLTELEATGRGGGGTER